MPQLAALSATAPGRLGVEGRLAFEGVAPLGHALGALLAQPWIQTALAMAAVSCLAVLWWMRPRERKPGKGARHVGVLGF